MNRRIFAGATLIVLCLVAVVYQPVSLAELVWDDKIIFHDNAWLRYGDGWRHLIFRNFFDWAEYFRPLVVALFVFEARVLDAASGPMHLMSLGIHLANTLLVGVLGRNLLQANFGPAKSVIFLPSISMLLYGLHPALVEPVVWISSQAELAVTFFILLGLVFNTALLKPALRGGCVGTCFFLAACSKESAVSFPLLLLLSDWMHLSTDQSAKPGARLRALWQRQRSVYLFVLAAGIAYLVLRHWALGVMVHPAAYEPFFSVARLQTVCVTYLTYWRILIWPMVGLGPLHEVATQQFAVFSSASLVVDLAAIAILLGGLYAAWKRKPLGWLVMAVTAGLLPVLHILPVAFDNSLYHERYAMTALAMMCAMLPMLGDALLAHSSGRRLMVVALLTGAVWLGLGVINIRATLPLWSDETKLWLWVLREHPDSISAKDHLLSTYIERNDFLHARPLADSLVAENARCPNCMINAANLALAQGDVIRALTALEKAKGMPALQNQPRQVQSFILATGQLRELQGDTKGAEEAYRDAITLAPLEPQAQMNLALLLARNSRVLEARQAADRALSLFAPDERDQRRQVFEQTLAGPAAAPATVHE